MPRRVRRGLIRDGGAGRAASESQARASPPDRRASSLSRAAVAGGVLSGMAQYERGAASVWSGREVRGEQVRAGGQRLGSAGEAAEQRMG
jgi:hypothetical protein